MLLSFPLLSGWWYYFREVSWCAQTPSSSAICVFNEAGRGVVDARLPTCHLLHPPDVYSDSAPLAVYMRTPSYNTTSLFKRAISILYIRVYSFVQTGHFLESYLFDLCAQSTDGEKLQM